MMGKEAGRKDSKENRRKGERNRTNKKRIQEGREQRHGKMKGEEGGQTKEKI